LKVLLLPQFVLLQHYFSGNLFRKQKGKAWNKLKRDSLKVQRAVKIICVHPCHPPDYRNDRKGWRNVREEILCASCETPCDRNG